MLYEKCIEINEEQKGGLQREAIADSSENIFSRWPSDLPTAVNVSRWLATSWQGGRGVWGLASIHHPLGA